MDLDGDGNQDILSGSWPGELFLFRGDSDGGFAAPEMIKNKNGDYINIGGGIHETARGITITGNATFQQDEKGHYVIYHGKRIESTHEKPVSVTGTASAAHAVDWDADGDFDLLVGDIRGNLHLIPNETTAGGYAFGKEQPVKAGGKSVVVSGDAGPYTADWDNDGDFDLLVGAGDGSVSLLRNHGSPQQPAFDAAEQLVPPGAVTYGADAPKAPTRGVRSKVCAADWNGDGRLDLLVGDYATQRPDLPEPTEAEKAEREKVQAQLNELQPEYSKLIQKYLGERSFKDKEEYDRVGEQLRELSQKMQELRAKLPEEYESHGWVWLFLRN